MLFSVETMKMYLRNKNIIMPMVKDTNCLINDPNCSGYIIIFIIEIKIKCEYRINRMVNMGVLGVLVILSNQYNKVITVKTAKSENVCTGKPSENNKPSKGIKRRNGAAFIILS